MGSNDLTVKTKTPPWEPEFLKKTRTTVVQQIPINKTVIDMRKLNYELPFDNPDGGTWKQGWEVPPTTRRPITVLVIPHSHCDPGWLQTFDEYFRTQTKNILNTVVDSLIQDSRRTFIWAEISYFAWWWGEQSTERQAAVKRLLDNQQLEFVTGGWVMPDVSNIHHPMGSSYVSAAAVEPNLTFILIPNTGSQRTIVRYGNSASGRT